jgi:N-acetylglutamate synthase-like GNAT family acetyltransferase
MGIRIIGIREHPEYLQRGIDFLSIRWSVDRKIYDDCIRHSIDAKGPLPQWYLMLKEERIIGGFGLLINDFISRQDLLPWMCTLYIAEKERGRQLGARLMEHGKKEAAKLGYEKLYCNTELEGYYEKYGWKYIANGFHPWGVESKIYETSTNG